MDPLWIAPPALLRASGLAAEGLDYLTDGVHLRVEVHPLLGFPIHPFVAWRVYAPPIEPIEQSLRWVAGDNTELPAPVTIPDGEQVMGFLPAASVDNPWIFVELWIEGHGLIRVDAFGPGGVTDDYIVATRREPLYRFGFTGISHVRVQGSCTITKVTANSLNRVPLEFAGDPDAVFGLPGAYWWHQPNPVTDPRADAYQRIKDAAPTRLTPPDEVLAPGIVTGTDSGREADRLEALADELINPWLDAGFNKTAVLPTEASLPPLPFDLPHNYPRHDAVVDAPITPSLLTMAVDPRISAYLGLSTMIPLPEPPLDPAGLWVIASRWLVQPDRLIAGGDNLIQTPLFMRNLLASAGEADTRFGARLDALFPGAAKHAQDGATLHGGPFGEWTTVTLAALAVVPHRAPVDPPDPLLTKRVVSEWSSRSDINDAAPVPWRCELELDGAPRGMIGFARTPGGSSLLHRYVPDPLEPSSRVLPIVVNRAVTQPAVLTDDTVPAQAAEVTWTVWQADLFGQWSAPATTNAHQPPRPAPPQPLPEASYEAYPDDGSTGLRAPGVVHLAYRVPDVIHSAPGASPITTLTVTVDGNPQPSQAVTPGDDPVVIEASPQSTTVGARTTITIDSTYTTSTGESSTATTPCEIFDARAPLPVHTSPIIAWTSFPDSTGAAHIDLAWPAAGGAARYRIYLGDARRLAASLPLDIPDNTTRAAVAGLIHARSADVASKDVFTLLGETIEPRFTATVDGALRNTQFVRVVPLTDGGAESGFASCGLVPIAVPHSEKPPQPVLGVEYTDAAASLTLAATGVAAALTATAAPEYRILQAIPGNNDPDFAIPHGSPGALASDDGGVSGVWHARVALADADLHPFVTTTWWAQCRYPAEAPTDGGAPLPPDGGVHPEWPPLGESAQSLWSLASGPIQTVHIPAEDPSPPDPPTATRTPSGVTITTAGLPPSTPAMIARYILEIYRFTAAADPDNRYVRLAAINTADGTVECNDPSPTPADRYDLVLVDPIGRRSSPTRVPAPA